MPIATHSRPWSGPDPLWFDQVLSPRLISHGQHFLPFLPTRIFALPRFPLSQGPISSGLCSPAWANSAPREGPGTFSNSPRTGHWSTFGFPSWHWILGEGSESGLPDIQIFVGTWDSTSGVGSARSTFLKFSLRKPTSRFPYPYQTHPV